jgi:death-on-curing protein
MMKVNFLTLRQVLIILEDQIKNYGGEYGIRDINLLNSAIFMPESTFDGQYLHKSIPTMAASYAFHICLNHPFVDGNKRVALASSLVFLDINGYDFDCPNDELYKTIIAVAKGESSKDDLIEFYERHSYKTREPAYPK